jgi:hypothetical protein
MVRTIALIGLVAAVTGAQGAFAACPSGYGTEGPNGQRLCGQAESSFQRHWNYDNESKYRAEASAEWMRRHHKHFPLPF